MSWQQLQSMLAEFRADREAERAGPPQACPNDGEPLRLGPDGMLFCTWDGWKEDGSYVTVRGAGR